MSIASVCAYYVHHFEDLPQGSIATRMSWVGFDRVALEAARILLAIALPPDSWAWLDEPDDDEGEDDSIVERSPSATPQLG